MKQIWSKIWLKIIIWASKYCPPGYRYDKEMKTILVSWLLAIIISLITFGYGFAQDCQRISSYNDYMENEAPILLTKHPVLQNDALIIMQMIEEDYHMTPFYILVSGTVLWFVLSAIFVSGAYIISHYRYYRCETKSIYLMMRLDSNRLKESYYKVPLCGFVLHILTCIFLLTVYFVSYQIAIGLLF